MKNLLARWGVTLSLVGTTLLGTVGLTSMQARALPEQDVVQKLREVPVFTIRTAEGALVRQEVVADDEKKASIITVFISEQAAQAAVEKVKSENPELGSVQVVPLSLAEYYQSIAEYHQRAQQNNSDRIIFNLLPERKQLEAAISMLRQSEQEEERVIGVPLFFARLGKEGRVLPIQRGESEVVVPLFFNKEDLQGMLDNIKEASPNEMPEIEIDVAFLHEVIVVLKKEEAQWLNHVVLVPSRESVEYARSLQPPQPPQNENQ